MKILNRSKSIRSLINRAIKAYRRGDSACYYVYLHKLNGEVYYVGMGSHDRAVRVAGRSKLWYKDVCLDQLEVDIVTELLSKEKAEKVERQYIDLHKNTCINQQLKQMNGSIISFLRNGTIVKEYAVFIDVSTDGFDGGCVKECCEGTRGIHKNMIWMYKSDYEANGFSHKVASNHSRIINQLDSEGNIVRSLLTAQAFEQFGFVPKLIQQVCTSHKKTHMGYVFQYK